MQINLVNIGNSKGIVLSQALIKQCGFKNVIDVELADHSLILKAPEQPRQGWEKLFESTSETQDEALEDTAMLALQNRWDKEEWEW